MMKAGRLDRLITIQSKAETKSDSGEPVTAWSNLVTRRRASMSPIRGTEEFATPEKVAYQQTQFWIRYSANVAGLQPNLHRIIYPALNNGQAAEPVAENSVYDILAVNEVGTREGFQIVAQRRPDVTT